MSMRINTINRNTPFKSYSVKNRYTRQNNLSFGYGYKDIPDIKNRAEFDRELEATIKSIKYNSLLNFKKSKDVEINGIPAKLTRYNGFDYVLSSYDGTVNAVMETYNVKKPLNCPSLFYSDDDNGRLDIVLLISQGEGAGSLLIKEAVKRSKELGHEGRVALYAYSIKKAAGYPEPFYYKMGFRAADSKKQKELEEAMEIYNKTGEYNGPDGIDMYLDERRIKEYLD